MTRFPVIHARGTASHSRRPCTSEWRWRPRGWVPLALLSLVLAACGSAGSSGGSSGSSAKASGPTWTIGAVLDLTGPGASEGQAEKTGIDFALQNLNATGGVDGHQLKIDTCDTQSTPTGGAQCATQLSSVDSHVVLLLGSLPSTLGAVPHLSGAVGIAIVPVLFPKAGTNVYQMAALENEVVSPFIKAAKAGHISTIGVIYVSNASGSAQLHSVQTEASAAGLKVVSEPMDPSATDVTAQLTKLKSEGAQVIFSATIGPADAAVISSYPTLGMTMPSVMGAEAVTNDFLHGLSFPLPSKLYGISTLAIGPGFPSAVEKAWSKLRTDFKSYAHYPIDSEGGSAQYSMCVAAGALGGTHGGSVTALQQYLSSKAIPCFGSQIRFNVPGLNVSTGEPTGLLQAGPAASDGWGPVRNGL